jgi:xanthine dehydrogenase accessory factor
MTDLEPILALWRELESSGTDYVLATIVAVEGSGYRRPGANMLLASDGRRTGTVSGGCLEADVAKRAWWLTENGPVIERFSTMEEDGERPYGSGCGGVVYLLLERKKTAAPMLAALQAAFERRVPLAIATVLEGPHIGERAIADDRVGEKGRISFHDKVASTANDALAGLALIALEKRASLERKIAVDGAAARVWVDYRPARPALWIFGAGDDAKPLLSFGRELGCFVVVSDGRSHLATRDRFPAADEVRVLDLQAAPGSELQGFDLRATDAVVLMSHSYEQDARVLASLLAMERPPAYIGVLGPQRRTREMLAEAAHLLNLPAKEDLIERWLKAIHAPTGLDIGAETPAAIALSILAEIQQTLNHGSGAPLGVTRATKLEATQR